jgi:hypothetical protein
MARRLSSILRDAASPLLRMRAVFAARFSSLSTRIILILRAAKGGVAKDGLFFVIPCAMRRATPLCRHGIAHGYAYNDPGPAQQHFMLQCIRDDGTI